jgi:PAS domain S-box-containing protein
VTARRSRGEEDDQIYQLLVQSVVDYAIFVLDAGGHVRTWNPGAERLKGYTRDEIVGRHFSTFYTDEDRASGFPDHELVVAAAEGRFEDEGWRVRRDGSTFWANVVITALRREGQLIGYAKVTRDLTERKQAEEQRERLLQQERASRQEAEEANRAKSEFLATVSHELRTPMNAVFGYLQLLEMEVHGKLNQRQAEALARIRNSQQHLLALIDELLDFTRIQMKKLDVRGEELALAEVIEAVRGRLPPAEGVEIRFGEGESDLRVRGARKRVEEILLNLIGNALKFTPAGGRIEVSAAGREGEVEIEVCDTGSGIPPEKLEKIFEPFVQVRDAAKGDSSRQGLGLGLATSRELARAMDGELTAESVAGKGSVFRLRLPAAEAGSPPEPA